MSPDEPLAAHRIALRAASCAVTGGLAASGVALPLVLLSGEQGKSFLMGLAVTSGLAMGAFFTIAVETIRRLPPTGRLPALVALGAVSPIFVMCALLWCFNLSQGVRPEAAWDEIVDWLDGMVSNYLARSLPTLAAVLIPFSVVGAAHAGGLPGLLGRALSGNVRVVLATITGAVAFGIASLAYDPPERVRVLFWGFLFVPPAMELAIAVALRFERRLLTWWEKRREAGE